METTSDRLGMLRRWFGIDPDLSREAPRADQSVVDEVLELARPGAIVFITGPSGSGKSSLLRELRGRLARRRRTIVDVDSIQLRELALVDCFEEQPLDATLSMLSRVGLAEAWSYFRTPAQLSEGQRWRVKLALAGMKLRDERRGVLVSDEFCAVLDRVTAVVVARSLRRMVDAQDGLCSIVATSHDDLVRALEPDAIVECDFGRTHFVARARDAARRFALGRP
jgi:ABC-type ATPase with predicted acetyltransferase domain